MRADGSNKKEIGQQDYGGSRKPNWSPNGGRIVYQRYYPNSEKAEIAVMDTSGQNPVRLTLNDHDDAHPKYSPEGTRIAFYSDPPIGPASIWMMNSDGSNLRQVSPEYAWRFDWSPDGRKFVFLFWDFLNERRGNGQLWLINTDGSGLRQLTHFKRD